MLFSGYGMIIVLMNAPYLCLTAQNQASQHSRMGEGGPNEASSIAEELLAADATRRGRGHFYSWVWTADTLPMPW